MALSALMASVVAAIGTWIQLTDHLGRLSVLDPSGFAALKVVDSWRDEFGKIRNPVRWYRNQRMVGELLKASPTEAAEYRRAQGTVGSWALILLASLIAIGTSTPAALALVLGSIRS